jgi:alkylated DNA repair protein (DNA oxidative demethylase)
MSFAGELWDEDRSMDLRRRGLIVLRAFALPLEDALLSGIERIAAVAPFRHMRTRGGREMSAAMTNCGTVGWVSDEGGYRYDPLDPASGKPWPPVPTAFLTLAQEAAARAGFADFRPDACLINRYGPAARMSLHQDRDERDLDAPIVSVSLGLPVEFLWGASHRSARTERVKLHHGDVVAWGASARLHFHGVAPLPDGRHARLGRCRINLTFRRAL